jgi:hypothetical protein
MGIFNRKHTLAPAVWLLLAFASIPAIAQVAWVNTFDEALKQAAKEKKFIVLDISASW